MKYPWPRERNPCQDGQRAPRATHRQRNTRGAGHGQEKTGGHGREEGAGEERLNL